jgi:hypothetical protein
MTRRLIRLLTLLSSAAAVGLTAVPAQAIPLEDYASYQPQTRCSPKAKPGTRQLSRWIVNHFDGGYGPISRPCGSGGTSEHKEGRAFDWTLDATKRADRLRAAAMLERIFRARQDGEEHVLARRMGIMYIIWNDHMYSAYDRFARSDYLSSSCTTTTGCSTTLRHRNHMHISLTRKAARAETSWYVARNAS